MIFYDAGDMTFEDVTIRKDPGCPVCADDPAIDSVHEVEYADTCAISAD
jgi:adenylyltransferase/sulfurtransferase